MGQPSLLDELAREDLRIVGGERVWRETFTKRLHLVARHHPGVGELFDELFQSDRHGANLKCVIVERF